MNETETLRPCASVELAFAGGETAAAVSLERATRIAGGATLRETRGAWRDDDGAVVIESAYELRADFPASADDPYGAPYAYGAARAAAAIIAAAIIDATDETAVWARVTRTDGRVIAGELRRVACDIHGADSMAHHADGSATCGRCYVERAR